MIRVAATLYGMARAVACDAGSSADTARMRLGRVIVLIEKPKRKTAAPMSGAT